MKIIRFLIAVTIIGVVLFGAVKLLKTASESNTLNAEDYTFDYSTDANGVNRIVLTINKSFSKANLKINDKDIKATIVKYDDTSISIGIDANIIKYNELITFSVSLQDENSEQLENIEIKDVCFSQNGKVPKYDIKSLVLYNYSGKAFPEFDDSKLKSLFIINKSRVKKNISLDDINHITTLESLYVDANGGVSGSIKPLKALREIRRLVITNAPAVNGELDSIDGLDFMEIFILEKTSIQGRLKDLTPLNKITYLRLANNKNLSGNIKWLKKLTKLETVELLNSKFKGDIGELEDMEALSKLHIERCRGLYGSLTLCNGNEVELE